MFILVCSYTGPLLDVDAFCAAVEEGTNSVDFTKLVELLTTELAEIAALEDHVRAINSRLLNYCKLLNYYWWLVWH